MRRTKYRNLHQVRRRQPAANSESNNSRVRFVHLFRVLTWLLFCCGFVACTNPGTPPTTLDGSDSATFASEPTLADLWSGRAGFVVDVPDTGLPMGESDSISMVDGIQWSYVHASDQSAGVIDSCGDPVAFPGCVILLQSQDDARTFQPRSAKNDQIQCLIPCLRCPCDSKLDHIDQQQYPQVVRTTNALGIESWIMVYEYRANVMVRRSSDGQSWSAPEEVPLTGIWRDWLMDCAESERIGPHPHTATNYDCLSGSPPGALVTHNEIGELELYVFVGLGQNPGHMGCYRGSPGTPAALLRKCSHNPLFTGSASYGPIDQSGAQTNPFFDFRTVSSAEVVPVEDRYYMLYEGVRGPEAGASGDTQFALGMARSTTDQIDGPWERFSGNPILVDQPGNVGVGHADLLVLDGRTYLFTSLDGEIRSRLLLQWLSE